jgi:hypothetical protein
LIRNLLFQLGQLLLLCLSQFLKPVSILLFEFVPVGDVAADEDALLLDEVVLGGQDFLHLPVVFVLELLDFSVVGILLLVVLSGEFGGDHFV